MSTATWRKSSFSSGEDNANCVELSWRKSSRSSDEDNANCVELAACPTCTSVRDSKNPEGPTLQFPEVGWRAFLFSSKA